MNKKIKINIASSALSKKIKDSITLLQTMCRGKTVELCYSGGKDSDVILELAKFANDIFIRAVPIGWSNKMFVKSDLMPHQIKITDIRCERLQDISTDDCMKEGIYCSHIEGIDDAYSYDATNDSKRKKWWYRTPIEAYKMLSCKLHLHRDSNPLVFVYDFKLVK